MSAERICSSVHSTPDSYVKLENAVGILMLPQEVVEVIAAHLTAEEVAACCAVSVEWRELFNRGVFWERFCDKRLAQYLSSTDPRVKPIFTVPEDCEDRLTPVSDWRKSYMREAHLWANWRAGRYKSEKIRDTSNIYEFSLVYNNHFLLRIDINTVQVWDLRWSPVLYVKNPCRLISNLNVSYCKIHEDKIILVQRPVVFVYRIDLMAEKWPLHQVFLYDDATRCTLQEAEYIVRNYNERNGFHLFICVASGDLFIAGDHYSKYLHVWNFVTGVKIKREVFTSNSQVVSIVPSATSTTELVVVLRVDENNLTFLVYDLILFRVYPFRNSCTSIAAYMIRSYSYLGNYTNETVVLAGDYLAIRNCMDGLLEVYNYKTGQPVNTLIDQDSRKIGFFRNSFVFGKSKKLAVFSPADGRFNDILVMDSEIYSFHIICNRFFCVYCRRPKSGTNISVWEIDGGFRRIVNVPNCITNVDLWTTNEVCTKLVQQLAEGGIRVTTYW